MSKKQYAIIGSWTGESNKGLHTFEYDADTLEFKEKENYYSYMNVGCTPHISSKNVLYVLNETLKDKEYGGRIYTFKVENQTLTYMNEASTLTVNPCFSVLSKDEKHLLVVHHTSSQNGVSVVEKEEDGSIVSYIKHDEAAVVLYALKEDGSIGNVLDIHVPQKEFDKKTQRKHSKLHSIYLDSKTNLYFVFDKGLDKVYTYKIVDNKLQYLNCVNCLSGCKPRYGVVHPVEKILYGTNEGQKYVYVYAYTEDGRITQINEICLSEKENKDCLASDIQKHPFKDILYVALRGIDDLFVLDIKDAKNPVKLQELHCEGKHTKAITISKDGNYLFSCNMDSDNVAIFKIEENGCLSYIKDVKVNKASSIIFID